MRKELTKEEIYLLARIKRVDAGTLLNIKKLLDIGKVRSTLIEYEYKERIKDKKNKTFLKKHIIEALMEKYGISKGTIEIIIYNKRPNKGKQCVRCGQYISTFRWNRNDGVCDNCIKTEILNHKIDE